MDLFNRDELRRLAEFEDGLCISLYMPTHQYRSDWSQNTTRFKNLLKEVRGQLREEGYRGPEIDKILEEAETLLDRPGFWREMSLGLAVFITADATETYRLPLTFEEVAIVNDRCHLKPLFPLIAANNRFYLLALSQNDVRLYQGTHQAISEVKTAEIPTNILEAIRQYEEAPEQGLQSHTQSRVMSVDGTDMDQGQHGQGSADDQTREPKSDIKRFFRKIDNSVTDYLRDGNAPLILAGVKEYLPLYQEANSYPHLVRDEIVAGNPEGLSLKELHAGAWEIVEPVFLSRQQDQIERFEELYYQDQKLASDNFHEIVPACAYSRVSILFVPVGQYRWGRFDPDANTVELHESKEAGDGDLLNYAAVQSYLNGAAVHAIRPENMPGGRSIAAIFRYEADVTAAESG